MLVFAALLLLGFPLLLTLAMLEVLPDSEDSHHQLLREPPQIGTRDLQKTTCDSALLCIAALLAFLQLAILVDITQHGGFFLHEIAQGIHLVHIYADCENRHL